MIKYLGYINLNRIPNTEVKEEEEVPEVVVVVPLLSLVTGYLIVLCL